MFLIIIGTDLQKLNHNFDQICLMASERYGKCQQPNTTSKWLSVELFCYLILEFPGLSVS